MQPVDQFKSIDILFEDNHLLIVVKPPGMLSQEDRTGDPDILTLCKQYLKQKYDKPGNVFLGLVHRLDRPASGLMVFAKTSKAASRLSDQVRKRQMKKFYQIIVHGHTPPNGVLVDHLLKDSNSNTVSVAPPTNKDAKRAELSYLLQSYSSESNLSLLRVNLVTGRSHQIRVQLSHAGFPLYGDVKYSSNSVGEHSLALHASELIFSHPISQNSMHFKSTPEAIYPWSLFKFT